MSDTAPDSRAVPSIGEYVQAAIERIAQSLAAIASPDVLPGSYEQDAEVILAGLLDLPVEQRMAAMGMRPHSYGNGPSWEATDA